MARRMFSHEYKLEAVKLVRQSALGTSCFIMRVESFSKCCAVQTRTAPKDEWPAPR